MRLPQQAVSNQTHLGHTIGDMADQAAKAGTPTTTERTAKETDTVSACRRARKINE